MTSPTATATDRLRGVVAQLLARRERRDLESGAFADQGLPNNISAAESAVGWTERGAVGGGAGVGVPSARICEVCCSLWFERPGRQPPSGPAAQKAHPAPCSVSGAWSGQGVTPATCTAFGLRFGVLSSARPTLPPYRTCVLRLSRGRPLGR